MSITTLPITNGQGLNLLNTSVTAYVYNDVSGELATTATAVTNGTTGVLVVANASIVATVMYRVVIMLEDSSLGIERIRAL